MKERRTTATEAQISKSIMEWLAAKHIFALRMNSGTALATYKGKTRAIHMHAKGTADILVLPRKREGFLTTLAIPNGFSADFKRWIIHPLWIEVKDAKGKQSDVQKSFQAKVEAEGHRYAICRSIEDVEAAL